MTDEASNTLLYAPLGSSIDDAACVHLAESVPLADATFICITFTQTADDRLAVYRGHDCDRPRRTGVISVGVGGRSSAPTESVRVMSVSNPNDLSRVGLTLSKYLGEVDDGPTVVCLHSVTGLLQFVGRDRAYRFLLTLKGELEAAGAAAHYHMDPEAHSAETEYTLRPAFDRVVDANELLEGETPETPFAGPPTPEVSTPGSADAPEPLDQPAEAEGQSAESEGTTLPDETGPATEDTAESPEPAEPDDATEPAEEADDSEFIWGPDLAPEAAPVARQPAGTADDSEFIWGPHVGTDAGTGQRRAAPEGTGAGEAAEETTAGTPVEWVESPGGEHEEQGLLGRVAAGADRVLRTAVGAVLVVGGAAAAVLDVTVASPVLLRLTGVLAAVVGAILLSERRQN